MVVFLATLGEPGGLGTEKTSHGTLSTTVQLVRLCPAQGRALCPLIAPSTAPPWGAILRGLGVP